MFIFQKCLVEGVQGAFNPCLSVRTRGKISWLHFNLTKKKRGVLSSDNVLDLKVKEQHQPGAKQRLKGQLCISKGCKIISYYLLLTHLFRK